MIAQAVVVRMIVRVDGGTGRGEVRDEALVRSGGRVVVLHLDDGGFPAWPGLLAGEFVSLLVARVCLIHFDRPGKARGAFVPGGPDTVGQGRAVFWVMPEF